MTEEGYSGKYRIVNGKKIYGSHYKESVQPAVDPVEEAEDVLDILLDKIDSMDSHLVELINLIRLYQVQFESKEKEIGTHLKYIYS